VEPEVDEVELEAGNADVRGNVEVEVEVEAEVEEAVEEIEDTEPVCSATLTPNDVEVTVTPPVVVVVNMLVAVVVAVHAVQLVHWGLVSHDPLVHPDHEEPGHPF
jgi:hypothetical protein